MDVVPFCQRVARDITGKGGHAQQDVTECQGGGGSEE